LIHESTLPYQGGQGGSNLKSIFNLIITSYLYFTWLLFNSYIKKQQVRLFYLGFSLVTV